MIRCDMGMREGRVEDLSVWNVKVNGREMVSDLGPSRLLWFGLPWDDLLFMLFLDIVDKCFSPLFDSCDLQQVRMVRHT